MGQSVIRVRSEEERWGGGSITGHGLRGLQSCYSDSRKGCNSGSEAFKKVSVTVKRGMQIY